MSLAPLPSASRMRLAAGGAEASGLLPHTTTQAVLVTSGTSYVPSVRMRAMIWQRKQMLSTEKQLGVP